MVFLKDEEKQILWDRYLDIEWPDDVADLLCVRCQRVVINHYVSNCRHLFCNNCRRVFSDGGRWKCPQCRQYVTQLDDQDFDVEIKINRLQIFCLNRKYGCRYEDQLRKIPSHLKKCVDTREAALPMVYKGTNTMEAVVDRLTKVNAIIGELKDGMREVKYKVEEQFNQLERTTDDVATKFDVLTDRMTTIESNVEGILVDMELASKKYTEGTQSMTSILESIDKRVQHIESVIQQSTEIASETREELRIKIESIIRKIDALHDKKSDDVNLLKTETYEWTIKDTKNQFQMENWEFESEMFTFIGYKLGIKVKLERKNGKLAIRVQFKDGNKINELVNKIGFTTVKYLIRNQHETQEKRDIVFIRHLNFCNRFGKYDWIFGQGLTDVILSPPYTKDNCIRITILFEPPSVDRSFVSNNGILLWRVDNYKARKNRQFYWPIWSPCFYTSPQGYRVRIKLLINYNGIMVCDVHFLTGDHDALLSRNFHHKTTITLINQTDQSKNFVNSAQHENTLLYNIGLQSSQLIERNGYVKDDLLVLKVAIEPITIQ